LQRYATTSQPDMVLSMFPYQPSSHGSGVVYGQEGNRFEASKHNKPQSATNGGSGYGYVALKHGGEILRQNGGELIRSVDEFEETGQEGGGCCGTINAIPAAHKDIDEVRVLRGLMSLVMEKRKDGKKESAWLSRNTDHDIDDKF